MHLNWDAAPPQITGTVRETNGGAWIAQLTSELAGSGLGLANYTLLIPPGTNAPANSPGGDGYALITSHLGTVTLTGALADGAAFSQTVAESKTHHLPIYAAPYTNGLLLGWLDLSGGAPAGSLTWICPATASGFFPNGFTNAVTVQSSAWTNPPPHTAAIDLPSGQLDISGGGLVSPLIFYVAVSNNNALVKLAGSPTNSLKGTNNPKTGLLTITFGNGNGTNTTAGTGAVLQNQNSGGGFFTNTANAGAFSLTPSQ